MSFLLENIADVKEIFKGINVPIFFIATNADRGIGLEKIIPNYHIVCIDYDDEVEYLENHNIDIFCLEKALNKKNVIFRNSGILLRQSGVLDYFNNYIKQAKNSGEKLNIMAFKPSLMIEKICREYKWNLLNNSVSASAHFENKLIFYKIARQLDLLIPQTKEADIGKISYKKLKDEFGDFVIQRAAGFAGKTTYFIRNENDYLAFKKQYSSEKVKISQFIYGLPLTINACATKFGTVIGEPCYQITGVPVCTNNPGTTSGNDWGIFAKNLKITYKSIAEITKAVGGYMKKNGFKGMFGLDLIFEPITGKIYLIECNPRFIASVPMATKLEIAGGKIPLLALHILEFLNIDYEIKNLELASWGVSPEGAQLVIRNIENKKCAVTGKFKSGIYKFENGKILFIRRGYSVEDIKNNREFVVLSAFKRRFINPESECARIESKESLLENDYKLKDWVGIAAKEIYKSLRLA